LSFVLSLRCVVLLFCHLWLFFGGEEERGRREEKYVVSSPQLPFACVLHEFAAVTRAFGFRAPSASCVDSPGALVFFQVRHFLGGVIYHTLVRGRLLHSAVVGTLSLSPSGVDGWIHPLSGSVGGGNSETHRAPPPRRG